MKRFPLFAELFFISAVVIIGAKLLSWDSPQTAKVWVIAMILTFLQRIFRKSSNTKKDDLNTPVMETKKQSKKELIIVAVIIIAVLSFIFYQAYIISNSTPTLTNSKPATWTAKEKQELVDTCEKSGNIKFCTCYVNTLTNKYTFDELEKMVQQSKESGNTSPEIKEATSACVSN